VAAAAAAAARNIIFFLKTVFSSFTFFRCAHVLIPISVLEEEKKTPTILL